MDHAHQLIKAEGAQFKYCVVGDCAYKEDINTTEEIPRIHSFKDDPNIPDPVCTWCGKPKSQHPPKQEAHPNLNAGNPGNDGGRPSKWKDEFCEQLIQHMERGYSLESFGAVAGVGKSTIYDWIKEKPKFSDAFQEGQAKSLRFWEALGINIVAGKIEKTNATIYALHMANKHKWVSSRQDVTTDGDKIQSTVVYIPKKNEE